MLKLVAVYARRHEPQWLINDLRRNIAWVDQIVEVDDRDRPPGEAWGHEGTMRALQRQRAIEAGADWILVMDPDERLEDRARLAIPPLIARLQSSKVVVQLRLRELFTADKYRVDGRWRDVWRGRLYPAREDSVMSNKPIHTPPCPVNPDYRRVRVDINLYHLKMVEPANRAARAAAYHGAEAQHGHPGRRWSGLVSTAGMLLQTVPQARRFTPPYARPYVIGAPE